MLGAQDTIAQNRRLTPRRLIPRVVFRKHGRGKRLRSAPGGNQQVRPLFGVRERQVWGVYSGSRNTVTAFNWR